jgi:hypothetical protein
MSSSNTPMDSTRPAKRARLSSPKLPTPAKQDNASDLPGEVQEMPAQDHFSNKLADDILYTALRPELTLKDLANLSHASRGWETKIRRLTQIVTAPFTAALFQRCEKEVKSLQFRDMPVDEAMRGYFKAIGPAWSFPQDDWWTVEADFINAYYEQNTHWLPEGDHEAVSRIVGMLVRCSNIFECAKVWMICPDMYNLSVEAPTPRSCELYANWMACHRWLNADEPEMVSLKGNILYQPEDEWLEEASWDHALKEAMKDPSSLNDPIERFLPMVQVVRSMATQDLPSAFTDRSVAEMLERVQADSLVDHRSWQSSDRFAKAMSFYSTPETMNKLRNLQSHLEDMFALPKLVGGRFKPALRFAYPQAREILVCCAEKLERLNGYLGKDDLAVAALMEHTKVEWTYVNSTRVRRDSRVMRMA